jgi:hypothetical protein
VSYKDGVRFLFSVRDDVSVDKKTSMATSLILKLVGLIYKIQSFESANRDSVYMHRLR